MGRPTTKADLIETANTNYQELNAFILSLTEKELTTPFEFGQEKRRLIGKEIKTLGIFWCIFTNGISFCFTGYVPIRKGKTNPFFRNRIIGKTMEN